MISKLRILFPALVSISFLAPACRPIPQGNPQGAAPAGRPAQAQVALAPAPIQMGKLPPQEPLSADARKPGLVLRVGHTQSVQALAFSADGKWLASGGHDKSILVWNLSSGREEFHLGGLYGASITYSADGKSLLVPVEKCATNATETAIGFYDAKTGKSQRTIPTKWDFVSAIVPTKDGRLIWRVAGVGCCNRNGDRYVERRGGESRSLQCRR